MHLVSQLESPMRFKERVLCLDSYNESFIRQYRKGSFDDLIDTAELLKKRGWIDRIIIAPENTDVIRNSHKRWFDLDCEKTHTHKGSPSFVHIWGLEQLNTRYALMCDVDIFIGRRDFAHDYLAEMLSAISQESILSVGFNIPFAADEPFHEYDSPAGGYVPETRCGLLDLKRIYAQLPLPNVLTQDKVKLTWYRSLELLQKSTSLRSLRGGSSKTYYAHPQNDIKSKDGFIGVIRDCFDQNSLPDVQFGKWDIDGTKEQWVDAKANSAVNASNRKTRYPINMHRLEVDLTYRCQLRCSNCSRGCTQLPSDADISIEQIVRFLDSSLQQGRRWDKVSILGGEPTLHPDFNEIINIMHEWFEKNSPHSDIKVVSNGAGKFVRERYYQIPQDWQTENSFKDGTDPDYFDPVNIAPIDLPEFEGEDFSKACWVAMECGMALTPNGYFPCPVAGAIDRMFSMNCGKSELPKDTDNLQFELSKYCALCGHYLKDKFEPRDKRAKLIGNPRTESWINILGPCK